VRAHDFEVVAGRRDRGASRKIEHVAAGQHDRQAIHPGPRRTVLVGGCPRGVGRDRAAREGARERGDRWKPAAVRLQLLLQRHERQACANAHVRRIEVIAGRHSFRREEQAPIGRGAARHRRLRADREHARRRHHEGGHLALRPRARDRVRVTAGVMRRVFEVESKDIRRLLERNRRGGTARLARAHDHGRHDDSLSAGCSVMRAKIFKAGHEGHEDA